MKMDNGLISLNSLRLIFLEWRPAHHCLPVSDALLVVCEGRDNLIAVAEVVYVVVVVVVVVVVAVAVDVLLLMMMMMTTLLLLLLMMMMMMMMMMIRESWR